VLGVSLSRVFSLLRRCSDIKGVSNGAMNEADDFTITRND